MASPTVSVATGLTTDEQVPLDLKGQITVDDADGGGDILTVTITVAYGVLAIDVGTSGVTLVTDTDTTKTFTGTLAQIQALLDTDPTSVLTYTPDTDTPPADTLLEVTIDDGTNPPVADDDTIAITPVNDAPYLDLDFTDSTATGFDSAVAWQEGDAPVVLAFAVELDDDDLDNSYPGATLTVGFTANGAADDQLAILSVGNGLGEIRIDGGDIYYENTLVGTFTGGDDGSDLVATFNAAACHCAVQQVIQSITYANDSSTPGNATRTVTFTLVDGGGAPLGGGDTASALATVAVTDLVNEVPTVEVTLPAAPLPVAGEFMVNANTPGSQGSPGVAAFGDGSYVVVWITDNDTGDSVIQGRIFLADSTPVGDEFQVNTVGDPEFRAPAVAVLDDGGFVVTWESWNVNTTSQLSIQGQRFDAAGDPVDGEFQVNSSVTAVQRQPAIAALEGGGFVIVWQAIGTSNDIFGQRYDADGDPVDGEFLVNSFTASAQENPEIAATPDGGFVVTWTSIGQDGTDGGVYAQRFDAAGDPADSEFRVNTTATEDERDPHIAVLADGSFIITWLSYQGTDGEIHARHYAANGTALGSSFTVWNGPPNEVNVDPRVTALEDGGFVVTWHNEETGDFEAFARRFDASAVALGVPFSVNTAPGAYRPVPVGLADGSFVIVWGGNEDGDLGSIQAQHFAGHFAAVEQVALDIKGRIALADVDDSGGSYTVTLAVTEGVLDVDPGTSGAAVDDSDQQNIVITGTLAQIQALLDTDATSSVTYTYDDDYLPLAAIEFSVTIDDSINTATETVAIGLTPVNDAADLDLDFFTPGNDATATYVQGDPATLIAFNATFDDDNADWDGATLTIAITGATADDQLTIDDTLLFDTTVVGNDIFYQGDLVGTWSGGDDGTALVITFNEEACACAIEEVTYGIAYANSSANPAPSTRDVTFTFVDGDGVANGGTDTASATVELTLSPAPDAPVVDAGAAASGDEDAPIALTGIVITDDGDPVTGLITVHLEVASGSITIRTDVSGGITGADVIGGENGGRGITITATPAAINATLAEVDGLLYQGGPDYNGGDALTISVSDGDPSSPLMISSLSAQFFGGAPPTAVAVGDLDGDFVDDLVLGLGEDGPAPGLILTLSGGFGGGALPAHSPEAFAFGDFDGDSDVDIAFAAYDDGGTGYVGFLSSDTGVVEVIAGVPYALDLVAADFDGNGLVDLAVADSDNGRVGILLQTAAGVFAAPDYSATSGLIANGLALGDFNDDGALDLLVSYYGTVGTFDPPGAVDLMLGDGNGGFAAATRLWSGPSNVGDIVVGDFNGDGHDDYAFASIDDTADPGAVNGVQVALGNGDGSFDDPVGYATSADGAPMRVVAGDLNGDGILDLLVTNFDDPGTFSVLVGEGDGSFQAPVEFDTGDLAYVAALGDFDPDGDLDLMIGNYGDGTFEAFNNDTFRRTTIETKTITINAVNDAPVATISPGLLAGGEVGGTGEFVVNSVTAGFQQSPAVAALADGGFVAVWESTGAGGIAGQRFDAEGNPVGTEFLVPGSTGSDTVPAVTALPGGGYVVAWVNASNDIAAQRFDADGDAVGAGFLANATTGDFQSAPAIATLADGGFVVAWTSNLQDGDEGGVYAQRFAADGSPVDGEFLVPDVTAGSQGDPQVGALPGGGFVITWISASDGSGAGIYAKVYDDAGVGGTAFLVNTTIANGQSEPSIAVLEDGSFVITWSHPTGLNPAFGEIYAQRYAADGTPIDGEFQVNTNSPGDHMGSHVTALADGGFLVSWRVTGQEGVTSNVYAQRYAADGTPVDAEFRLHPNVPNEQLHNAVVGLTGGGFAAVWTNVVLSLISYDIHGQVFAGEYRATEQVGLELKGTLSVADVDAGTGAMLVTLAVADGIITVVAGASGVDVTDNGTGSVTLEGTLAEIAALLADNGIGSILYTADDDDPPASTTLTLTIDDQGSTGSGGPETGTATATINITGVDDPVLAEDDSDTVAENATVAIDVTANDADPDSPGTPTILEIEGVTPTVGVAITLASGATVTLNANGTITYNTNGQFAYLVPASLGTGAVNTSFADSFDYTLVGGSTATASVTVTGVTSLLDEFHGDTGNNTLTGTAGANLFMLHQGGSDIVSGGGGTDGFYMGSQLDVGDSIDGGTNNGTDDQVGLQGNYVNYVFSAQNLQNIETLVLLSGSETRFGDPGTNFYDYHLTTVDANVAAGATLIVNGNQLRAGEDLYFDGSAETNGKFTFYLASGDDTLIGGAGADIFYGRLGQDVLTGNGGSDTFYFRALDDSTTLAMDSITDFTAGDKINMVGIDARTTVAGDQAFTFIGGAAFTNTAGQLRVSGSGTSWTVEVDVNGDGIADMAIAVTTTVSGYTFTGGDFVL